MSCARFCRARIPIRLGFSGRIASATIFSSRLSSGRGEVTVVLTGERNVVPAAQCTRGIFPGGPREKEHECVPRRIERWDGSSGRCSLIRIVLERSWARWIFICLPKEIIWRFTKNLAPICAQFGVEKGVYFAVWAPDAQRVSVVGDFNGWDGRVSRCAGSSAAACGNCFARCGRRRTLQVRDPHRRGAIF